MIVILPVRSRAATDGGGSWKVVSPDFGAFFGRCRQV